MSTILASTEYAHAHSNILGWIPKTPAMRKRNHRIWTYLNDEEYNHFLKSVEETGVTKEGYVRSLLSCNIPPPIVPDELHNIIKELRSIGNNLNQIARLANATRHIQYDEYKSNADRLFQEILAIKQEIARPTKLERVVMTNGNNKDMDD